jgi:hypothetical protein
VAALAAAAWQYGMAAWHGGLLYLLVERDCFGILTRTVMSSCRHGARSSEIYSFSILNDAWTEGCKAQARGAGAGEGQESKWPIESESVSFLTAPNRTAPPVIKLVQTYPRPRW